jgi:hypothetical protein
VNTTTADFAAQFDLLMKINKKLTETHKAINKINKAEKQLNDYTASVSDTALASKMKKFTKPVTDSLDVVKGFLYNYKAQAIQDVLNYPIQLNDKLAGIGSVVGSADTKPTKASYEAYNDVSARIDQQLLRMNKILDEKIPEFNQMVKDAALPAVDIKAK